MNALLKLLHEYQLDVETRAFAHYASSRYHRRMGVRWSIAAAGLTALASLATLTGTATLIKPFKTQLPTLELSTPIIIFLAIVLFAFAIASALEANLAHPKQAMSHMASYAGYSHAMRRLETLRLRCGNPSTASSEESTFLNLLDEISQQIKDVAAVSIYPLPAAYESGQRIKKANCDFKREWSETFDPVSAQLDHD
jgi:hypothetical protein